jgi:hypothetical protein
VAALPCLPCPGAGRGRGRGLSAGVAEGQRRAHGARPPPPPRRRRAQQPLHRLGGAAQHLAPLRPEPPLRRGVTDGHAQRRRPPRILLLPHGGGGGGGGVRPAGVGNYENVGKSQSALILINPVISLRTRTAARAGEPMTGSPCMQSPRHGDPTPPPTPRPPRTAWREFRLGVSADLVDSQPMSIPYPRTAAHLVAGDSRS